MACVYRGAFLSTFFYLHRVSKQNGKCDYKNKYPNYPKYFLHRKLPVLNIPRPYIEMCNNYDHPAHAACNEIARRVNAQPSCNRSDPCGDEQRFTDEENVLEHLPPQIRMDVRMRSRATKNLPLRIFDSKTTADPSLRSG